MSAERTQDGSPGVLDGLLAPLRLPQRIVAQIDTIATAVTSLSGTADERLPSIDERAGELVQALDAMGASLARAEDKVEQLTGLEAMIQERLDAVREDLNRRMLAIEGQLNEIQTPITQMMSDVAEIKQLLPDPADGPLARLKDQLTKE